MKWLQRWRQWRRVRRIIRNARSVGWEPQPWQLRMLVTLMEADQLRRAQEAHARDLQGYRERWTS